MCKPSKELIGKVGYEAAEQVAGAVNKATKESGVLALEICREIHHDFSALTKKQVTTCVGRAFLDIGMATLIKNMGVEDEDDREQLMVYFRESLEMGCRLLLERDV